MSSPAPQLKTENLNGTRLLIADTSVLRLLEGILLTLRAIRTKIEHPQQG